MHFCNLRKKTIFYNHGDSTAKIVFTYLVAFLVFAQHADFWLFNIFEKIYM
jgi:hypothetical protein